MAKNIFVFSAADPAARTNLKISITAGIPESLIQENCTSEDVEFLNSSRLDGELYAWGAQPGPMNDKYYAQVEPGDIVICAFESKYQFVATVTHKLTNRGLATALWGAGRDGSTWEKMFFLTRPQKIEIPLEEVSEYLPRQVYGFARVGGDKTANIHRDFDSIDEFAQQKLTLDRPPASVFELPTATESTNQYFVLRSNKNSKWADQKGRSYRFGSTVPNYTKLIKGGYVVIDSKDKAGARVVGIGRLAPSNAVPPLPDEPLQHKYFESAFLEWEEIDGHPPFSNAIVSELEKQQGYNNQHAVRPVSKEFYENVLEFLREDRHVAASIEFFEISDALRDLFMDEREFDRAIRLLGSKKNIILQGSPGVGKTLVAKRLAYAMVGIKDDRYIEAVQFHQAYSYEDFVQGFRPDPTTGGFAIRNGVFYEFCERARSEPEKISCS
ncbi:AAA family ATPase [Massilia eburnea]|uniref:AAA family ATPase n=1 Tax=Massilia eburnea TaxID=1776165 RepID=UPI003D6C0514